MARLESKRPTLSFATRDSVAKFVVGHAPFPPTIPTSVSSHYTSMWLLSRYIIWYVFIFNLYTIFLNSVVSVKTTKLSDGRKLFQPHLKKLGNRTATLPKVMFGVAQPTKTMRGVP